MIISLFLALFPLGRQLCGHGDQPQKISDDETRAMVMKIPEGNAKPLSNATWDPDAVTPNKIQTMTMV